MGQLERQVKQLALELGFDIVGLASAEPFIRDREAALERVRQGLMDGLPWFTEERVLRASDPGSLLPGAKSIISVAMSYHTGEAREDDAEPRGRVARYAWGDDYHKVMKKRLRQLADSLGERLGRPVKARIFVDDGPMLERAAAERAGIGWFGKNANILTSTHGSWVFLGQLITDLELEPDEPLKKTCGTCRICIDKCPTGAIVAPYVIDNNRCISYLTIECRGAIPRNLRPLVGDWVFGCDICQDVCPVNKKALQSRETGFQQRHGFAAPSLIPLLSLTDDEFRERFRNSPIKRAKRVGLQRNVCVALGNIGDPVAIPPLTAALGEAEPLVRAHAAWALGRIGGPEALRSLERALGMEEDQGIREEIDLAIQECKVAANEDPTLSKV